MVFILCIVEWIWDHGSGSDHADIDTSTPDSHRRTPFKNIDSDEVYQEYECGDGRKKEYFCAKETVGHFHK